MAQLICRNVAVGYGSKVVLHNIDFEVHAGNYICIAGENGSGKTTLMKTILGLQKPLKGEIHLGDGLHANEIGYRRSRPFCKRISRHPYWRSCCPAFREHAASVPFIPEKKKSVRRKLCRK